jgi:hypothetical protein
MEKAFRSFTPFCYLLAGIIINPLFRQSVLLVVTPAREYKFYAFLLLPG